MLDDAAGFLFALFSKRKAAFDTIIEKRLFNMAGEAYQVEYIITLNDGATAGLRTFADATKGLTKAAENLKAFEKQFNEIAAKLNQPIRFQVEEKSFTNLNSKLNKVLEKIEKIKREAKGIAIGSAGNAGANARRQKMGKGASGGGTTAPQVVASAQRQRTARQSNATVGPAPKPKPAKQPAAPKPKAPRPVRGSDLFGYARIDSGGIMGMDMLKGMGLMYGVSAIGTGMRDIIQTSAEYENIMQTAKNILKANYKGGNFNAAFADMEKIAREVGMETKFTAPEVADAVRFLAMAGLPIESIKKAIRPIADIALIGDTELGETADVMTNIMTAYKIKPDDMRKTADIMSRTFTMSNTTLMELAESFKMSGSILQQAGVPFETAAAAFGVLGDAGIKATMAGTTMRTIIANMTKPTKSQRDYWATLGVRRIDEYGNLRDINEIFGDLAKVNNERGTAKLAQEHFKKLEEQYAPQFDALKDAGKVDTKEWFDLEKEYNKASDEIRAMYGGVDVFRLFRLTAASGGGVLMGSIEKWNKIIEENFLSEGLSQKLADAKKNQIIGLWAQLRSAFQEQGLRLFEENDGLIRGYLNRAISFVKSDDFAKILRDVVDLLKDVARWIVRITRYIVDLYQRFAPLVKGYLWFQIWMSGIGKLWTAGKNITNSIKWFSGGSQGKFPFLARQTGAQGLAVQSGWMNGLPMPWNNKRLLKSKLPKGLQRFVNNGPQMPSVPIVPPPVAPVMPRKPGLADPKQSKAYKTWQRMANNAPVMPSAPQPRPEPVMPVAKPVMPKKTSFPDPRKKGKSEYNWDRYDREMRKYNAQLAEYNRYQAYLSGKAAYDPKYVGFHESMEHYNAKYTGYSRRMSAAEDKYMKMQAEYDRQWEMYNAGYAEYKAQNDAYLAKKKARGEYLKQRKKEIRKQQKKDQWKGYHQRNAGWSAMAGGVVGGMLASEIAPESEWAGTIGGLAGSLGAMALATSSIPFAGLITAGVLAAGAVTLKLVKQYNDAKKAADAYAASLKKLNTETWNVNTTEDMLTASFRLRGNTLLSEQNKLKASIELWDRYYAALKGDGEVADPEQKGYMYENDTYFQTLVDKMTGKGGTRFMKESLKDFKGREEYNYAYAFEQIKNMYPDIDEIDKYYALEYDNGLALALTALNPNNRVLDYDVGNWLESATTGVGSMESLNKRIEEFRQKFMTPAGELLSFKQQTDDIEGYKAKTNAELLQYPTYYALMIPRLQQVLNDYTAKMKAILGVEGVNATKAAFDLYKDAIFKKGKWEGPSFGESGFADSFTSFIRQNGVDEEEQKALGVEAFKNTVAIFNKASDFQKKALLPMLNRDYWEAVLGVDLKGISGGFNAPTKDNTSPYGDMFKWNAQKGYYEYDGLPSLPGYDGGTWMFKTDNQETGVNQNQSVSNIADFINQENPVPQDSTLMNVAREFTNTSAMLANANVEPWREAVDRISYKAQWEPVTREEVDRATTEPLYAAFAPSYTPFMPPLSQPAASNEAFRPAERQQVAMVARPVVININAERLVDFGTLNIDNATDDEEIAQKVRNALEGILAEVAESTGGNYNYGVSA